MALPAAGQEITFQVVNTHLKRTPTAALPLNDAQVRALAGKPSGKIAMSDLAGKWAGSRVTVGAGNNGALGNFYGYKSAPFAGPTGSCEGEYAGATPLSVLWTVSDGVVYVATTATPNSNTLRITDDSFNVIGTYTLAAWNDAAQVGGPAGSKYSYAFVATNPFGTTTGAKRWFTW